MTGRRYQAVTAQPTCCSGAKYPLLPPGDCSCCTADGLWAHRETCPPAPGEGAPGPGTDPRGGHGNHTRTEMPERAIPPPNGAPSTSASGGHGEGPNPTQERDGSAATQPCTAGRGAAVPGELYCGPPKSGRAMGRAEARSERQTGAWWHVVHVLAAHARAQRSLSVCIHVQLKNHSALPVLLLL